MVDVLRHNVEQSGRFSPKATAEEVAAALASDVTSKIVVITGASPTSIGAEAARTIDDTIIAIGALGSNNLKAVEVDLSDLDSVRKAAAEILKATPVVDVIINNAGIMMIPEYRTSKQSFELHLATNHLGHFLLTNLLVPALLKSSPRPTVVNVASAGHRASPVHFDDLNFDNGKTYDPFVACGQSKTANILFTVSLNGKLRKRGIRSFSLDPSGWWNPDGSLNQSIPWTTVHQGAATYIVTGFDPTIDGLSGRYFVQNNVDSTTEQYSLDPESAEKLWGLSEKMVGQEFRLD